MPTEARDLTLRSEFAAVSVSVIGPPGRERLRIEDLRTQQVAHLDALELESLAWCCHTDLHPLVDPAAMRWPSMASDAGRP